MRFVVFLPKETRKQKVSFVIFLSGLTCNEVLKIDRTISSQNQVLLELRQSSVLLLFAQIPAPAQELKETMSPGILECQLAST